MIQILWMIIDLVLVILTLILAHAAVTGQDLRRSVVMFIAFGLMLAIVWARLRAPDLALAEAAIGAGLAGALMLAALRDEPDTAPSRDSSTGPLAWLLTLFCTLLGGAVAWAYYLAIEIADPARLADRVAADLPQSGVSNPVTAVLLNFRAYDTLLELAVLLAAVAGILGLGPARRPYHPAGPLLAGLVNWLVPLLILMGGYLLWVGAHAPGGAFQAGAVLAGAAVMLRLAGHPQAGLPAPSLQRWLLAGGVGMFLLVGLGVTAAGQAFLQYPPAWAGALILLIEAAAMLAIAATLTLAYLGGRQEEAD